MRALLEWLGLTAEDPGRFAVRPARNVEVALPFGKAFDRCVYGLEEIVGAHIEVSDRRRGYLEATFGLMFSERIACTLRSAGNATLVALESRRGAGSTVPKDANVLDRLESWLKEGR